MSEEKDNDTEKTEEPTSHRLQEAFKRGNVAVSREVVHWFILGMASLILITLLPYSAQLYVRLFSPYIHDPDQWTLDPITVQILFQNIIKDLFIILLPLIGSFIIAAIAAGLLQTRFSLSFHPLKPQLKRLSPITGFKRLFSKKALIEFLKGFLKVFIVSLTLYTFFMTKAADIPGFLNLKMENFLPTISSYISCVILVVMISLTLIAILDYLYQKYEHMKSLRMTKDEVKREYKNQEGDPQVKSRRRQMAQQRIRRHLKESMEKATAVITNPTHYAVAIQYDHETMDAPVVVAKGVDFIALKMKELANECHVPIIENPPLARALHAHVDLDQEIPPEHYKAVAEIIRFVMMLEKQQF